MIIEYNDQYYKEYQELITSLWKDIEETEIKEIIKDHKLGTGKIFLYVDDKIYGFVNTTIRNDYVEGCHSLGVGYIEGIYVCEKVRRNQIAIQLIEHVVRYFKSIGIKEIGSDTEIENEISQFFHKAVGFKEVSRNVHYIMKIGD
jgi:aminoglycoside 6'-N-acetyltransferase I